MQDNSCSRVAISEASVDQDQENVSLHESDKPKDGQYEQVPTVQSPQNGIQAKIEERVIDITQINPEISDSKPYLLQNVLAPIVNWYFTLIWGFSIIFLVCLFILARLGLLFILAHLYNIV